MGILGSSAVPGEFSLNFHWTELYCQLLPYLLISFFILTVKPETMSYSVLPVKSKLFFSIDIFRKLNLVYFATVFYVDWKRFSHICFQRPVFLIQADAFCIEWKQCYTNTIP